MTAYEMIFIVDPDIPDEDIDQITERLAGIVDDCNGKMVKIEKWGKKKLAYRVKKRERGNYILLVFSGDRGLTSELERILKLDDRVLKYLTVRLDKHAERKLAEEKEEAEEKESADSDVKEETEEKESANDDVKEED